MNARQMEAGREPPVTAIPCTFVMGTRPRGYPIHTQVATSVVYPQNHASA